jgi:[acyl-carrier-protein] S-malonyltransferase
MRSILFPGQGSQSVGMGKEFCDTFSTARHTFEEANDALGMNLTDVIFNGPQDLLTLTENTQPALVTVSIAVLRTILCELKKPIEEICSYTAGHSLGEYAALCASGVVDFQDAVRLVKKRGQAMQTAVPVGVGAMAAVIGLDHDQIENVLANIPDCVIANDNSPGQIVISGTVNAVQHATPLLQEAGAKRVLGLPVSAPFHSPLMKVAADVMADALADVHFKKPVVSIVPNVLATPVKDADFKKLLVDQICGRVRWRESILALNEHGVTNYVECGAGKVLQGLNKRIVPEANIQSVNTPADLDTFLKSM